MTGSSPIRIFFDLIKIRIVVMQVVSMAIGFVSANWGTPFQTAIFLLTVMGTLFTAAGAALLNNWMEREKDAKMERTRQRPLATGALSPTLSVIVGLAFSVIGVLILAKYVNFLTAILSLATILLYLFLYTPFKRLSWINTFFGAIPGALPPLGGWTAVKNSVELEPLILFLILFLWQLPHFFSIAWIYKDDYTNAGFKMLPSIDPTGSRTARQIVIHTFSLLFVSIFPFLFNIAGIVYLIGMLSAGIGFCWVGIKFSKTKSTASARRVLRYSVLYLPVLLIFIIVDKFL